VKSISEKIEERRKHYKGTLPEAWGHYVDVALHEAIAIAQEHEQLQGRRETETWRNPGWEEREEETRS
jgi:hypothetical protein